MRMPVESPVFPIVFPNQSPGGPEAAVVTAGGGSNRSQIPSATEVETGSTLSSPQLVSTCVF